MKKILFLFCIVLSFQAAAQEGELPEEYFTIVKNKKNVLPEVAKPQEKVTLSLKPLPKVKQKYTYKEFSLLLPLLDPKLKWNAHQHPESLHSNVHSPLNQAA